MNTPDLMAMAGPQLKNAFVSGGLVLMAVGVVTAWARNLPLVVWRWFLRRVTLAIDVTSSDPAFWWIQFWLEQQPYAKRARTLSVAARRDSDGDRSDKLHAVLTPAPGDHLFRYGWRPVWLDRHRDASPTKNSEWETVPRETITLRIFGRSQKIVRELVEDARRLAMRETQPPMVFSSSSGISGAWNRLGPVSMRPLHSVVLPEGTAEPVVARLKTFLASRGWYEERGVPYRLGLLFHGVPGSGKTSFVVALAHALHLNLYSLNLASLSGDSSLESFLLGMTMPAILLLEDVDAATTSVQKRQGKGNKREESSRGVSLSGLLNAIDGVIAREGLITVFSTNHLERLDPALTRPGRADVWVEFGYADDSQIRRMFQRFFGDADIGELLNMPDAVTTAELQEHFMRYRDDAALAVARRGEIAQHRRQLQAAS